MAYDETTAQQVRHILAARSSVSEKRMMGALVFMVNGSMCCGVSGSALMVRTGAEAYERMLAQPHVRPLEIGGRRTRGFVLIDPEGYRTDKALARWVELGIDVAATVSAKKLPARRGQPKAPRT
ncbi:MAG TPA: TfoX/Sxy family protein [Vineibacter sp.]|nr:TfoX/Sxy family protein [Vineibacter sp.]